MKTALRIGFATALVAISAAVPLALQHRAGVESSAKREALRQQALQSSLLVQENLRLSNLVAQAKPSPPLTGEKLRELLRLRNELRLLGGQTNLAARLQEEKKQLEARLASGASVPPQLSPAEFKAASMAEERARITELAASVGISAEDAGRFFDQFTQLEKTLGPKLEELQRSPTGSLEERQRQMRAIEEEELKKLALETLGDKGLALVQKLLEQETGERK
jgi:hypothetical protein